MLGLEAKSDATNPVGTLEPSPKTFFVSVFLSIANDRANLIFLLFSALRFTSLESLKL